MVCGWQDSPPFRCLGTYDGAEEGSNGYLLGIRYNFGDPQAREQEGMPPPLGCEDPNRDQRPPSLPLEQQLEAVVFDGPSAQEAAAEPTQEIAQNTPTLSPQEQLAQRRAAIADLDQRVTDVGLDWGFNFQQVWAPELDRLSARERQFSVATPQNQIRELGQKTNLVSGKSPIGASRLLSCSSPQRVVGRSVSFTSDPFTPAQPGLMLKR